MADYPSEYEVDVVLRDGGVAHVRPIRPDDDERLVRFFDQLGPQSRYFRFFRVKQSLDPEEIAYFTTVDYDQRLALVALVGREMVAVGRYDRMPEDPGIAEVAFAVADSHQGRGLGTELLQLLTSVARSRGIGRFRAFVLPENVQMMRVFRNTGYELSRTLDAGVYTVDFPVLESEDARIASGERERRAVAASLLPLFFPRSIAVVGASTRPGSIGNRLFGNLLREGFTGPLYPVNPTARVVNSVRAYPTVLDVPDEVDMAFVVVPADQVIPVVKECAEKGVRGVVVISAGFSEVGDEGVARERDLVEVVRSAGMRMVGPNCMGLLNTALSARVNGTFAPGYPAPGNIAMLSQSGALGIAILDYAQSHSIGISQFISVGNKADVSGNDLLLAWEDDPATDVIVMYLESFGNPRKFSRIARRIARKKPIVAVKSGRTTAGSRAASSHTGALASSDVAVDALFAQTGVIRTNTIEELFGVANLLANQPIPAGRRVGIITNAGGPGILAADALEAAGLLLPELSPEIRARLAGGLPAEASTTNPIDLIAGAGSEQYEATLRTLLESDEVDSVMVIHIPTSPAGVGVIADAVKQVMKDYQGPVTVLAVLMQAFTAARSLDSGHHTIPTFIFPEPAAHALTRAVQYGEWQTKDPGVIPVFIDVEPDSARQVVRDALSRTGAEGGWLEPKEVEAILASFGVNLPLSVTVHSEDEAVAAAGRIEGPVAVKVLSPSALHKSDVGGVLLNVSGEEAVRQSYRQVTAAVADPEGVLIQEMVPEGHEVLIGSVEDPTFGPLMVFGLGGVMVELMGDVVFRIHPLSDADARAMVLSIKGARLFDGYRNLPLGDVAALEETLLRISALLSAIPELVEMDLNPVKVLTPGKGVRVVDARLRVVSIPPESAPELADLPSVKAHRVG